MAKGFSIFLAISAALTAGAAAGEPAYLDIVQRGGHARLTIATENTIGYSAQLSGGKLTIDFDRVLESDFNAPVASAPDYFTGAHHRDETSGLTFTTPEGARLLSAQSDGLIAIDIYLPSYVGVARSLISERDLVRARTRVFFAGRTPSLHPQRRTLILAETAPEPASEPAQAAVLQVDDSVLEQIKSAPASRQALRIAEDFERWRARVRQDGFALTEETLLTALAGATSPETRKAVLDIVSLYMAHGLHAEALVVLGDRNPKHDDADYTFLEGVNVYKMGRWEETVEILGAPLLKKEPDAALWRGMALVKLGAYDSALEVFADAADAHAPYEENGADYYLAKAEAFTAAGKGESAREALAAIRRRSLNDTQRATRSLVEARLLANEGNEHTAQSVYEQLAASAPAPFAQRAALDLLKLKYRTGALNAGEAHGMLHTLAFAWRGGAFEREALVFRATLCDVVKDTACAIEARRELFDDFKDSDAARDAAAAIGVQLSALFDDENLPPMQAAKLFYVNVDLAPPGREGDELIRDVAHELVALDLLDAAAELLRHQTFKRLRGAERAETAAALASVYLSDSRPADALRALRSSRFARLPEELNDRRRWLEARALIGTGEAEAAIELLKNDESRDAQALRGDVYWASKAWRMAGEAYAASFDMEADGYLSNAETIRALKAASAFALAGENVRLEAFAEQTAKRIDDDGARRMLQELGSDGLSGDPAAFLSAYRRYFERAGSDV